MVVSISPIEGLNFFMPIFAFLFVFILVYALLEKTKILGGTQWLHLFLSFLLAIFFIVNASLVDFIRFNSAWFAVFIVSLFFILLMIGFTHGKLDTIQKGWVAWVLIIGLIVFFIISSSYVFNWAINWAWFTGIFGTAWMGFVVLLVVALIASFILTKKAG
jgi:hypothetical protein